MVEQLKLKKHPFVMCNFAPPDMVGHTGVFEAAVKACEATGRFLCVFEQFQFSACFFRINYFQELLLRAQLRSKAEPQGKSFEFCRLFSQFLLRRWLSVRQCSDCGKCVFQKKTSFCTLFRDVTNNYKILISHVN